MTSRETQPDATAARHTLTVDGRRRTYLSVNEPDGATPSAPVDVLLFFHGSLQSGAVARRFTHHTFESLRNTAVVYPNGVHNHFNDGRRVLPEKTRELGIDDVAFTRAIVNDLRGRHTVGRVFAAGFSNGGHMVQRLLIDAPGLLDGAALIAATVPAADNRAFTRHLGEYVPTPVLAIHGTADPVVSYDGGPVNLGGITRGEMLSAPKSAAFFARLNGHGADADPAPARPQLEGADAATVQRWDAPAHPPVELWTIGGMGHLVPSGVESPDPRLGETATDLTAADIIARFFGLSTRP